jgi:UDPglucose 6-dehydrogenase
MQLIVVGTGYVGLVTGACFAEMGNQVTCVDTDAAKVAALKQGIIPIHEPGLDAIVARNAAEGRLQFTTALADALPGAEVLFIAVGTPPDEDGSADLRHVLAVARQVGELLNAPLVVVDKSTVPVGTADKVRHAIAAGLAARGVAHAFDVVSNPEFLKEGAAVEDFMKPDRVVVGVNLHSGDAPVTASPKPADGLAAMRRLYAPFMRNHDRLVVMGVRDAELTKYAANAMLATKISFMNEIAALCERVGADVEQVRKGIGSDSRIGYAFIYPGAGYGGSCFPKDVKALVHIGTENALSMGILEAVEARNQAQKQRLFEKISQHFGAQLQGRTIAVWGLAFKPGTDDIREAPALTLIESLLQAGVRVQAFDPVATANVRAHFSAVPASQLIFASDPYAAAEGADALALVTEWKQFRDPDFARLKSLLRTPVIFDGRNLYDPAMLHAQGFAHDAIGRRNRHFSAGPA